MVKGGYEAVGAAGLSLLDFACQLKAFFRSNHRNDFVDDSGSGNRALHDLHKRRCGGKCRTDNAGEHQRHAGMGEQRQPEIFSDGVRHVRCPGADPCSEIFSEGAEKNIDKGIQSRAENQTEVEGRA
mgnify:CR=1 FL=1